MTYEEKLLPNHCWSNKTIIPKMGVIHALSAKVTHPEDPFNDDYIRQILIDYGFSAHLGIKRQGDVIQWVPFGKKAYHAGLSHFKSLTNLNNHSIGIEVYGTDDQDFEQVQYESTAIQIINISENYGIPYSSWREHSEVSNHKVRSDPKWDPGHYFSMIRLGIEIQKRLQEVR